MERVKNMLTAGAGIVLVIALILMASGRVALGQEGVDVSPSTRQLPSNFEVCNEIKVLAEIGVTSDEIKRKALYEMTSVRKNPFEISHYDIKDGEPILGRPERGTRWYDLGFFKHKDKKHLHIMKVPESEAYYYRWENCDNLNENLG